MPQGFNNVPALQQQLGDNIVGGNFGGILSTRPAAKYMSGARVVLKINSLPVLFAFGISWNINTMYKEVTAIDNPLPEELVPQRIRVDGNITALHIPGIGMDAGSLLWQADPLSFLFHQYLTIEVRDSVSDGLLFYAPKAAITTRREEIKVDALAHVSLSFIAIGYRDEKDPSQPSGVRSLLATPAQIIALGDQISSEIDDLNTENLEQRLQATLSGSTTII